MNIELKILNKEFYEPVQGAIKVGDWVDRVQLPTYSTPGSAAIDLVATKDYTILPGEVVAVYTGLAIWIGSKDFVNNWQHSVNEMRDCDNSFLSYAALILPRSGRGAKEGLVIANTIGLIDEDYQGELIVYVMNRNTPIPNNPLLGDTLQVPFQRVGKIVIKQGERFAQMTFVPIIKAQFQIVEEFSNITERKGGHGSTGV